MTKSKKPLIISIISVILAGVIVGMVFLGIFLYRRYTPEVRFAHAQQTWEQANKKVAYDDIAIDLSMGYEGNTLDLLFTIAGDRTYEGDNISAFYLIDIFYVSDGLSPKIISLEAEAEIGEDDDFFKITQKDGLMDFSDIESNFTNEEIPIDLSFNKLMFHNTNRLAIAKDGNYYIEGQNAVNDLIDALSVLIADYIEIDLWSFLQNKTNFSRVKGDVYYDGAFFADKIKSSQNISFYMPWQELDEIVEDMADSIPENILNIYQEKKIEVEIPIVGEQTIDLLNYMPEGMLANIRIITETKYEILE